jgi:putative ABC transport system permease protein
VDTGLDPRNLLTMSVSLPGARYREPQQRVRFFEQVLDRVRGLPGVEAATAVSSPPVAGMTAGTAVEIEGYPKTTNENIRLTLVRSVMPGYFRTLKTRLLVGREFTRDEMRQGASIAFVVNQAFVRKYLAGQDPLSTRISVIMQRENPLGPILGVAADNLEGSLDKTSAPTVFYSYGRLTYPGLTLVVRTSDPALVARETSRIVRELDPNQPVTDFRSMEEVLAETVARQRMNAVVLMAFAVSALLLASIGIYGLLSFLAAERTREIGVRMALGAQSRNVVRLVVWQGMVPTCAGLAAGLLASFWLSRFLRTQLFQIEPFDPVTFAGSVALLLAIAGAAMWLPSARAARINPVVALRQE